MAWLRIVPHISKSARHTIGTQIDNKFIELLKLSYTTYFADKSQKQTKIIECILALDTLKFFLSIAWEAKIISHGQYELIAQKLVEVGKMFGGWKRSIE